MRKLLDDQPMTGLEKAMWWIDYVIRHKGASHLRSPAIDLPWYKYFLLDVITAISFFLIVIIYIIYAFLSFVIKFYCNYRVVKLKKH